MEMAAAAIGMTIGGYVMGAAGKKAAEEATRAATEVAVREAAESAAKEAARVAAEQAFEKVTKSVAVASGVALVAGAAFGAWYSSGSTEESRSQSNAGDNGSGPDGEISGGCCAEDENEDNSEFSCKGFDPRPKFQDEVSTSQDSKIEGAVTTDADMIVIDSKDMEVESQVDPLPRPNLIKCVVCFELLGDIHVIEPCLHANVCEECLAKITSVLDGFDGTTPKCPSCRVEITSTKRIYQ